MTFEEAKALVAKYTNEAIEEMVKRGERDPGNLTDEEVRVICARAWLNLNSHVN
jgi:hypothetical protein